MPGGCYLRLGFVGFLKPGDGNFGHTRSELKIAIPDLVRLKLEFYSGPRLAALWAALVASGREMPGGRYLRSGFGHFDRSDQRCWQSYQVGIGSKRSTWYESKMVTFLAQFSETGCPRTLAEGGGFGHARGGILVKNVYQILGGHRFLHLLPLLENLYQCGAISIGEFKI